MIDSVIKTRYGLVEGLERNGCTAYLGIPFAKAPVGELAFKHPIPPNPWQGVLKAHTGSANPIQAPGGFRIDNNSLDCLYLNIFVPQGVTTPMPVMVWFYGGSYSQGGAGAVERGSAEIHYDLSRFARNTGCVVVTFNYRLNLYGFLDLHALDSSFDRNNGLFDQIMALRFLKENIGAFGGDPENVTLFGQSAGGACILALMCMAEAEGLFHKSIVQSACIEHFFTQEECNRHTKAYLRFAGARSAANLKGLDARQVREANRKFGSWLMRRGDIRCAFSPVIDGVSLCGEPKEAVKKSALPMLIGNTSQEANLFFASIPSAVLPFVAKHIGLDVKKGASTYKQRACDALTEHIYVRPQLEVLKDYAGSAWRYEYNHAIPGNILGCFHASELPVLFGIDMLGYDGAKDELGVTVRSVWARFAREGNPGWNEGDTRVFV